MKIPNEDQNVKKEIKSKKNAAAETHDKKTSYLPLPPSRGPLKDSNTPVKINDVTPPSSKEKSQKTLDPVDSEIREIKRKETAAAVASMKDKLRNMGMLGRTGETGRKVDLSGRKKREGSAYKEKSSEITNEIDNEMKHKRDVDEDVEEEEEEGEETDTDSDNNDDEYEQDNVDIEDADGVQDSSRTINTNILVQPTGGASTQYKNEIFAPPPPPTELERKRENMMEIEELSFDNKDDSLNYEEEYSEDYGSIQGTIQFNNNSLFSKPSVSDASDTVVRDRVEEVEKGGVENMFFESELETAPESEISKNRVKKQEIFTADLGLSPSDTSSGKEENRSEEGSSGNNFKKEEESSENDIENENENENDIGNREEYLYKLYLDQENMLSMKSAQCKHIIRCAR